MEPRSKESRNYWENKNFNNAGGWEKSTDHGNIRAEKKRKTSNIITPQISKMQLVKEN